LLEQLEDHVLEVALLEHATTAERSAAPSPSAAEPSHEVRVKAPASMSGSGTAPDPDMLLPHFRPSCCDISKDISLIAIYRKGDFGHCSGVGAELTATADDADDAEAAG